MIGKIEQQEIINQASIQQIVANLLNTNDITKTQADNFLKDLQSAKGNRILQEINDQPTFHKTFFRCLIRGNFQELASERTAKKGKSCPLMNKPIEAISFVPTEEQAELYQQEELELTNQIREEIIRLMNDSEMLLKTITQLQIFKEEYKIRTKTLQILTNILGLKCIKIYSQKNEGKLISYTSNIDYLAEIFPTNTKHKQIVTFFAESNFKQGISIAMENQSACQMFNRNKGYIYKSSNPQQKIVMNFDFQLLPQKLIYKLPENSIYEKLIFQICRQVIELCMNGIAQLDNRQIFIHYSKIWLQIYELTLKLNGEILLWKTKEQLYGSQHNIEEIQETVNNFDELISLMKQKGKKNYELFQQFHSYEEFLNLEFESLRSYQEYLGTPYSIFIQFTGTGKLKFLSNNLKNDIIKKIKKRYKYKDIEIADIFHNNKELQSLIKKASNNTLKNHHFYQLSDMKVKIVTNGEGVIQKIQVFIIEDYDENIQNMSLSQQKSSSTHIMSEDSEGAKLGKSQNNEKILKDLEKVSPGIKDEGWLTLFLKGNQQARKGTSQLPKNRFLAQKRAKSQSEVPVMAQITKSMDNISISSAIQEINVDNIELNMLQVKEQLLQSFTIKVMNKLEFFKSLSYDKALFCKFLKQLHENYDIHCNPFHNFHHGVNVMHTSYLISTIPKNKQVFTPFKIFAIVFSALCHDVGHTGFTNAFEIASSSTKALTYNDNSPLQNFHASTTFEILRKPHNNFLQGLKREQFNQFRKDVISNILFTDIKEHFPLIKKFQEKKAKDNLLTPDDASILSGMIVHTSDFGGSVKEFSICREWSERVNRQFTNQYIQQGQLGLPQTPFMKDLDKLQVMSKNEGGFLKVIVHPLYKALNDFYVCDHRINGFLETLEKNMKEWQRIYNQQVKLAEQAKQQEQKQIE